MELAFLNIIYQQINATNRYSEQHIVRVLESNSVMSTNRAIKAKSNKMLQLPEVQAQII